MAGEDGEGFAIVLVGHVVGVMPKDLGSFDFHVLFDLVLERAAERAKAGY